MAIDRSQWREQNVFAIGLIEDRHAIPIYWLLLPKRGMSNLAEQKALVRPVLQLFKRSRILLLGDRELPACKTSKLIA